MANTYYPEATDGGDTGVWGPKELRQNRLSLGLNTCQLFDDSGTLKIKVGWIGLVDSGHGVLTIDTQTTISFAAVSNGTWFYVEVYRSGTTPVFAVTELPAETDPGSLPAMIDTTYEAEKGGFYNISTRRIVGYGWVNSSGTLEGVVNMGSFLEEYHGYSTTDDANDQVYRWDKTVDDTYDSNYIGKTYMFGVDERPAAAVLSAGTSTSFVNVDCSPYVPGGVKMLHFYSVIRMTGNGALDRVYLELRENGSSETALAKTIAAEHLHFNAPAGSFYGNGCWISTPCDSSGIIEYRLNTAAGEADLFLRGYSL